MSYNQNRQGGGYNRNNRRGGGYNQRGGGGGGYNRGGGGGGGYDRRRKGGGGGYNRRGRGRGGGGNSCFKCGEQGHFARDCPQGGGGGYNKRGGYDNRRGGGGRYDNRRGRGGGSGYDRRGGGGGYRGRGRGRGRGGRGRGRGGGFRGQERVERYHDAASQQLMDAVNHMNSLDPDGPQQVKCWVFNNQWHLIQSLSRGENYFFNNKSHHACNFGEIPEECKGEKYFDIKYQDQGSRFVKPPHSDVYGKDLGIVSGIVTNAYLLGGSLFKNMVHEYLVSFEPVLETKNVLERRSIVIGGSSKRRKINAGLLMEKFGYWAFDNHKFFSLGRPAFKQGCNDELKLNDKYKVKFTHHDSYHIDRETLPLTEEEQLLNIFKKKAMRNAQFNNVRDSWFYKDAANPPMPSMAPTHIGRNVTVLNGYTCSMRINQVTHQNDPNSGTGQGVFKADIASKLTSQTNVNQVLYDILNRYQHNVNDPAFINDCRRQLEGKFFIMRYNNSSTKIIQLDFTENEKSTFERGCGDTKVTISYKAYVQDQYGLRADKTEICMLKDFKGNAFLPQFAYLTLRSDECASEYDQILQVTNQPVQERLDRAQALVKLINKSEEEQEIKRANIEKDYHDRPPLNVGLTISIDGRAIETTCLPVNYPSITYRVDGRHDHTANIGDKNDFIWGGRNGTKGFLDDIRPIRKWCIVDDRRSYGAGNKIWEHWEAYCGMRRFDKRNGPIQEPQTFTIDMGRGFEEYIGIAKEKWDLIFVVLPDGVHGSEIKAHFTKAVQTNKMNGNNGCLVQCVLQKNARNKNAVLGAFEDSLAKCGNILFKLTPQLAENSPYYKHGGKDLRKIWTIGLDISHTTSKKGGKPSTAMMVLQTLPFYGTHRDMRCIAHLNRPRTEVIPFAATVTMCYNALKKEWKKLLNEETRPNVIMVFRDGVPDNQLKEVYGKEVVGIMRAIRMIKEEIISKCDGKSKCKWKPKVQFLVVSKAPIEKFGIRDSYTKRVLPLEFPAVVYNGITSQKLWDFFMWNYHPNKHRKINNIKPLRYVVLKDELKLGEKIGSNGPVGLYEIINTLFYSYVFAIPFNMGGTSQPGPIVYAKHYAETFAQMILSNDQNLKDLLVSKNLSTRPTICTDLILDKLQDIVNGTGNIGKGKGKKNENKNDPN